MAKAKQISIALADHAEAIVAQLLPGGKKAGNYWQAGDLNGSEGSSLFVHLCGDRRGKWRDAATGEHGDLLDLIALQNDVSIGRALVIANEMLKNPKFSTVERPIDQNTGRDTKKSAISLWQRSRPIMNKYSLHGQAYFNARGLNPARMADLRFHKAAWLQENGQKIERPAIIAAIRDGNGDIIAVHRTFLEAEQPVKAQIPEPKRALGQITGGACWLRRNGTPLFISEGIETAMSISLLFPDAALAAGITSHHMTVMQIRSEYQRIVIAADNDAAGRHASEVLTERLQDRHVSTIFSRYSDFNDDLTRDGIDEMNKTISRQIIL